MVSYPPKQREELIWCAVDFDGTIARSTWSVEDPTALPGGPLPGVQEKLSELREGGLKIVIHTSRSWADHELIEKYMIHHELPFDRIICGKLLAAVYIDDRARHSTEEDWLPLRRVEKRDSSD